MYDDPRILAFHFFFTCPNATEKDARIFAQRHLLASPLTAADFVIEWTRLRQRVTFERQAVSRRETNVDSSGMGNGVFDRHVRVRG